MSEDIFDIRDVLAGLDHPTGSVDIWFDRQGGIELDRLEKELAHEPDEKKAQKLLDEYTVKLEEYKNKKYTVHLQGIDNERKQDIQLQALKTYPFKRDAYGRDDQEQEYKRGLRLKDLIWQAYITKIVNPEGKVQEYPGLEVIHIFTTKAPDQVIQRIDNKIAEVEKDTDIQRFGQQDADFLSKP